MKKRTKFDPNEIIVKGDITEVVLYNDKNQEVARAIVDTEDVFEIIKYKWYASPNRTRTDYIPTTKLNGKLEPMANIIMGFNSNHSNMIDHSNQKTLDNRKFNLREASNSQNSYNKKKYSNNSSGFKGVSWDKEKKKWVAQISIDGKQTFLGYFQSKIKAARTYNAAAITNHKEFARCNGGI